MTSAGPMHRHKTEVTSETKKQPIYILQNLLNYIISSFKLWLVVEQCIFSSKHRKQKSKNWRDFWKMRKLQSVGYFEKSTLRYYDKNYVYIKMQKEDSQPCPTTFIWGQSMCRRWNSNNQNFKWFRWWDCLCVTQKQSTLCPRFICYVDSFSPLPQ